MFRLRVSPVELLGGGLLLLHVDKAVKHQRDCTTCAGRDFLGIAFNVGHVWKAPEHAEDAAARASDS